MNQNEPIFLNLYIRDTESPCKNTKNVGNKQIMRVKKLILFYKNQHFFTILLIHEPTLKSKACLKCLYFTKIISALCCYLEYFSYLYTIN